MPATAHRGGTAPPGPFSTMASTPSCASRWDDPPRGRVAARETPAMASRRSGTVTLLFTDIVGSTRRWELEGDHMAGVLARHDEILASAVSAHGGRMVKHTGDGLLA